MSRLPNIHGDSARAGIRLAIAHLTGRPPSEDTVLSLIRAMPAHGCNVIEFPMDRLDAEARERLINVRIYAMKALEGIIHHSGDTTMHSPDTFRKMAADAWVVAGEMQALDDVACQLGTLDKQPEIKPT